MWRALLLAMVAVGCSKSTPAPPARADEALDAQFAGCGAVVAGPTCELAESRIVRIFVPAARRSEVTFEGAESTEPPRDVPDGQLFSVRAREGATAIGVVRSGATRARFTLRVAPGTPLGWLREGYALRERGDFDGAESRAKEATSEPREQAAAAGLLARVALRRGKIDDALALFRRAIALNRTTGRISEEMENAVAVAFTLVERAHRFAEARAALDALEPVLAGYDEGRAHTTFARGQIAAETADPRTALALLDDARLRAERLGMARVSRASRHTRAFQLIDMGREDDALVVVRALDREIETATDATACEKVENAITAGYAELRLGRSDEGNARALAGNGACGDTYLRAIALGNLAQAAAREGRRDVARARLREARSALVEPRLSDALFWLDVEAEIARAEGEPAKAVTLYEREGAIAEAAQTHAEAWRAALGRGEALEAMHANALAIRAYEEAEALLERHSLAIPLGEGRAGFLRQGDRSARLLVDLLVRERRDADAMAAARRARRRVLSGVARAMRIGALEANERAAWEKAIGAYQRAREELDAEAVDDWKRSQSALREALAARRARSADLRKNLDDALAIVDGAARIAEPPAPPREGELLLAYHPARSGWIGFAADTSATHAFRIDAIDPSMSQDLLADRLIAPARESLARAHRLRVMASGWLQTVDFHALPFRGEPLVAAMPVEYALDLATTKVAATASTALVVADPTDDLPGTLAEASAVVKRLTDAGWSVTSVSGHDATSLRVREALAHAALFHYAGHGLFAGRDGLESALPLASGGALTIGDILALRVAPARVVLSGCNAAQTGESDGPDGLGLAQAFVLAGANFVIAPTRKLDDRIAANVTAALPFELAQNADGAEVLRVAQNRSRALGDAGWGALRVVVP